MNTRKLSEGALTCLAQLWVARADGPVSIADVGAHNCLADALLKLHPGHAGAGESPLPHWPGVPDQGFQLLQWQVSCMII